MNYLHTNRLPFLHGDFKPSDVLVPAKTLQPKITNFGLYDFKSFFVENAQPDFDYVGQMNAFQAPEVLIKGSLSNAKASPIHWTILEHFHVFSEQD